MIKKNSLLFLLLFSLSGTSYAQSYWDSRVSEKTIEGLTTIAQSIIADCFNPMTHYSEGEIKSSLVPAFFRIDKVMDDPEIDTENLEGFAGGTGVGYALSDRFIIYLIGAYMELDGDLTSNFYGDSHGSFDVSTDYSLLNIFAGMGYDIYDGEDLSIPVYLGMGYMKFNTRIVLPTLTVTAPIPYTLDVVVDGEDELLNFSFGVSISYNVFDSFRTSIYYLYTKSLNNPDLKAEINQSGTSMTQDLDLDHINTSMIGLNLTYVSSENWSVSINAGSSFATLSGFNNLFKDGMELYTVVFTLSFTTSLLD